MIKAQHPLFQEVIVMMENWKTALDQWLQSPFLSQNEKNTLSSSSPETLSPTFQSALSFGTAGLRGIAALGPGGVNRFTITQAALAFGHFLLPRGRSSAKRNLPVPGLPPEQP